MKAYFTLTTSMTLQMIREATATECDDPLRLAAVRNAWRGLIPTSPNTTYNATSQT
jgi:hypothetical protein